MAHGAAYKSLSPLVSKGGKKTPLTPSLQPVSYTGRRRRPVFTRPCCGPAGETFLPGPARCPALGRRRRRSRVLAAAQAPRRAVSLNRSCAPGKQRPSAPRPAGGCEPARAPAPAPGCAPRRARRPAGCSAARGGAARPRGEGRARRAGEAPRPVPRPRPRPRRSPTGGRGCAGAPVCFFPPAPDDFHRNLPRGRPGEPEDPRAPAPPRQLAAGACCWNVVELGGAASELECESCRFMCAAEHRHIGTDLHHFWAGGKAAGCRRKTLGRPLRLCLRVFIKVYRNYL
ncbi:uncharacterized protein [Manis javanica]|uniref:uncharacterized protein n=1 Tax=Manis javanica TaxID=9974 RepID=UPI003C6CCC5D